MTTVPCRGLNFSAHSSLGEERSEGRSDRRVVVEKEPARLSGEPQPRVGDGQPEAKSGSPRPAAKDAAADDNVDAAAEKPAAPATPEPAPAEDK